MEKSFNTITLLVLLFTFCSCRTSAILKANFESDTIGNPPSTSPAGDPAGDAIQYNSAVSPLLKVQNSATAGEKALHYTNLPVSGSGHETWLSFRGTNTNLTETIWFTYTATNVSPSANVLVDLTDGNVNLIARMRIRPNGDVGLATNITDDYTDVIGNIGPGLIHTIVFTTNAGTLKYNVTVFKSGGAITAENKPMITTNPLSFANPANPMISYRFSGASGSNHKYVIENVLITREEPKK